MTIALALKGNAPFGEVLLPVPEVLLPESQVKTITIRAIQQTNRTRVAKLPRVTRENLILN